MLEIATPNDLKDWVGKDLGTSPWLAMDQERINRFAEATEDRQWIHLDTERARAELPGGTTIAHGFLTLAVIAGLTVFTVTGSTRTINYGLDKVRFKNMVPSGSRVRLHQKLLRADNFPGNGVRAVVTNTVEIEGIDRPALVAESMAIFYA